VKPKTALGNRRAPKLVFDAPLMAIAGNSCPSSAKPLIAQSMKLHAELKS
jgi:hypothetical protein